MEYRKSLIKKVFLGRFGVGSITKEDFIQYTTRFLKIFEGVCGMSTVRIELYSKVPYFTSYIPSDEEIKTQKNFNEEGIRVLTELSELPEDFSATPYVRVLFHPTD